MPTCTSSTRRLASLSRPTWDHYWLGVAKAVSARSSCPRRSVGVVIVDRHNLIVSCGYNGAEAGEAHCTDVGCLMVDGHCKRAVHGDVNAILHAPYYPLNGCTMFIVGGSPCSACAQEIARAQIKRVVCDSTYPDPDAIKFLDSKGIPVEIIEMGED
jgi:dCMP deaminase